MTALELSLGLAPQRMTSADPQQYVDLAGQFAEFPRAVYVGDDGLTIANFSVVFRVTQPSGYSSFFSNRYAQLVTGKSQPVAFVIDDPSDPILYLLGYDTFVDVARGVVTSVEPPPRRVWVARCAWPGDELTVREPSFPRSACIALPSLAQAQPVVEPGPANLTAEGRGWLRAEAEGPGWLVTTQPWYPGWSARVDGQITPVEVVDGALTGVRLSPGPHQVTLSYRPALLEVGLIVSAVAGLLLLGLWRVGRFNWANRD